MTRRSRVLGGIAAVGVACAALGAGIAFATIPDSGVIHGCYVAKKGTLRVIDPSAGGACKATEVSLDWNQAGPQGPAPPPLSGSLDLDLVQKGSDVTVTGNSQRDATPIISSDPVTYDGSRVYITFFAPSVYSTVGNHLFVLVYRDSTLIGEVAYYMTPTFTEQSKTFTVVDTPPAGSHVYSLKGWGGGDAIIRGAPDGADGHHYFPFYLRIARS